MSQTEFEQLKNEAVRIIKYFTKSKALSLDDDLISVVIEKITSYKQHYDPTKGEEATYKMVIIRNAIFSFIKRKKDKNKIFSKSVSLEKALEIVDDSTKPNIEFNEILEYVNTLSFRESFLFKSYFIDGLKYREIAEVFNTTVSCEENRMKNVIKKICKKFKIKEKDVKIG